MIVGYRIKSTLVALSLVTGLGAPALEAGTQQDLIRGIVNLPHTRMVVLPQLLGDRREYWNDEGDAQFLLMLPGSLSTNDVLAGSAEAGAPGSQESSDESVPASQKATNAVPLADELVITLACQPAGTSNFTRLARAVLFRPLYPKTHFRVDTEALKPGRYRISAALQTAAHGPVTAPVEWEFTRTDKSHPPVAFPVEGIPVELEPQTVLADALLPMHVAVPLPRKGVSRTADLFLEENGQPVPSQITPVATWSPGGALRLVHVKFLARTVSGRSAAYRLRLADGKVPEGARNGAVTVLASEKDYVVDNGTVRFVVNRKSFNGIERAWHDPSGKGRYPLDKPVILSRSEAGPYLLDGRMIRFDASADKTVNVELEESGPVAVTVVATGWYVDSQKRPRAEPLCQFKTRITCYANQPAIQVSHHTIITYDTRTGLLADVGFHIPVTEAVTFSVGADGAVKSGSLPAVAADPKPNREGFTSIPGVFLHQDRSDHFRLVEPGKPVVEGTRADGWATVRLADKQTDLSVTLRDVWQKFPKELELSRRGLTLHFWPEHGHRAFEHAAELSLKNIYKFWCFHQNALLDLTLPVDYFDALTEDAEETRECRPAHALNGNGQGLAIGNEFEIRFGATSTPDTNGAVALAAQAALFQQAPAARTPPDWNARTEAFGPVAAADTRFAPIEDSIVKGLMSYNASVERGGDYGMWIWPDTHTYWFPAENRASLHRVWQNSHYHQVGNAWMIWSRGASFDWLRWARASSDHYRNVSTINYAELDETGRSSIKFHYPGAMYHCKGCTPWGSEAQGMARHDTHAGLYGHWTDPDAHLWAWQLDANPRARDLYEMWLASIRIKGLISKGTAREANNTLAVACTAYEATWDPDFLPVIHGLGQSLRTGKPLETQNPGPLWHPLWVNRYYHLTRDPEYVPFILKYGRFEWMGNTWNLGMAALAYEVSGDVSYLTAHVPRMNIFPRTLYRQAGDPYDNYGFAPGPMGFGWVEMTWGPFLKTLLDAGIKQMPAVENRGAEGAIVPLSYGRRRATAVGYALKRADRPWTINFGGAGIDNDMARSVFTVTAPDGTVVLKREIAQANAPRFTQEMPADGRTGLYRMEVAGFGVFRMASTTLDAHATILTTNTAYVFPRGCGYLMPLGKAAPVELTLGAAARLGDRMIGNVIVRDANGKELLQSSLCLHFNNKRVTVTLDPATNPLPWVVDFQGAVSVSLASESGRWMLAPGPEDLKLMRNPLAGMND